MGVIDFRSCEKCKCPLHLNCGFRAQGEDTISILCIECGEGRKRLVNKTLKGSQLSLQWLPYKKQRSTKIDESALIEKKEQKLELFYQDFYS
jgi:hypothetical protein